MSQELSFEEVTRMRQIVAQFDAARKPMTTVDLNNPPREPYKYQAFPKMVYDLNRSQPGHLITLTVRSQAELASALEDGWNETAPAFGDEPEESLSPKYQAEAEQVQAQIEDLKRKRGRPTRVA